MLNTNLSSTVQERVVTVDITGNVMTLAWNPNLGLVTKGVGDVIRTVTYSSTSLSLISLQPSMHPEQRTTLLQLLSGVAGALTNSAIVCAAAP